MSYSELLKDPRWQKKRLDVLNRDNWTCQACGNDKETLHVHHIYYEAGKKPWEYPIESLKTLCACCHKEEETRLKQMETLLVNAFRRVGLDATDMGVIICGLEECKYDSIFSSSLAYLFTSPELLKDLTHMFFDSFSSKEKANEVEPF